MNRNAKNRQGDVYVCALADEAPPMFFDDVLACCSRCAASIRHRPHAPANLLKICTRCYGPELEASARSGPVEVYLTRQTVTEVNEYLTRRRS